MRTIFSLPTLSLLIVATLLASGSVLGQATSSTLTLTTDFSNNFTGVSIAGAVDLGSDFSLGSGQITQIAFAPGNDTQAYLSTFENGIWRYDYDPTSANFLSNGVKVVNDSVLASPPSADPRLGTGDPNGSLGIAFHDDPNLGSVMYVAPAVAFGGGTVSSLADVQRQRIVRLTDAGGNGVFGDQSADVNQIIVDNVWVNTHHEINQLQVLGDSLFAAVGTRTSFGGTGNEFPGETAYSGSVNFIEDLTAISDQTTTNISGFNIPDFNTDGVINDFDAKVDSQPFASNDPSKLRVFSTGMRNIYGIAHDDQGDLWISMNEENSDGPDKLYESQFKDDHLFPKQNELVGDWKVNGDHDTNALASDPSGVALANGYFTNSVPEFVESNQARSSFGGLDFFSQLTEDEDLRGNILVSQSFDNQVLVMFDPVTGEQTTVLDGSTNDRILEVKTDSSGNLLVAGQDGRVTLVTVTSETVVDPPDPNGPVIADAAADYVAALSAPDAAPTELPSGWTYHSSDAITGGTESGLTILSGIGNAGNTGFGTDGGSFEVPAVVGNHNVSDEFEVFNDGFDGNGGNIISGNEGVVGEDLLLVPGFGTDDQFVIARYTVSTTDVEGAVSGTGSIEGSFRDLVAAATSNANNGGSVDVFVLHNDTPLFSVDRANDINNAGLLSLADGSFSLSGLTFAEGDTISFVVGNNGNIGGDETALQAAISIETVVPGDFTGDGIVDDADIDALSANLGLAVGDAADPTMDLDGNGTIELADHDLHITTQVQDVNGTGALIGDFNFDGDVDVSQFDPVTFTNVGDASVLLSNLGQTSGQSYADGDLNGDGDVDVSQFDPVTFANVGDASRLLASLGQSTNVQGAASAVPEPGSLTLLALTGITALFCRRKC